MSSILSAIVVDVFRDISQISECLSFYQAINNLLSSVRLNNSATANNEENDVIKN